ncbi:MAG: TlpA disulfide reductase family protein [Bacteroidales bacterium]|nr:TlpA disulfide reductase family protein [Bacteroidales bacterium]
MSNIKNIIYFLIIVLFTCCRNDKQQTDNYLVNGNFSDESYQGKYVYLKDKSTDEVLDSCLIENGIFHFEGEVKGTRLCTVFTNDIKTSFILEKGEINIDLSLPERPEGTKLNNLLSYMATQREEIRDDFLSTSRAIWQMEDVDDEERDSYFEENYDYFKSRIDSLYRDTFIENSSNSLGVQLMLKWSEYLTPTEFDEIISKADSTIINNNLIAKIAEVNKNLNNTSVGKKFVDFDVIEYDGSNSTFGNFVGNGKYTLVEFWASWCKTCEYERPILKHLYSKYKDKNIEFLGVVVWEEEYNFPKICQEITNYEWPQLLDPTDVSIKKYGILGIPHFILFDPDGIVVARGFRSHKIEKELMKAIK